MYTYNAQDLKTHITITNLVGGENGNHTLPRGNQMSGQDC